MNCAEFASMGFSCVPEVVDLETSNVEVNKCCKSDLSSNNATTSAPTVQPTVTVSTTGAVIPTVSTTPGNISSSTDFVS